ncbi:MAG: hypothetical protein J6K92_00400 [Oscillospiraceae bacterium]|nr:hypothetical protein [Oscillospiraceae bacterium]
MEKLRNKFIAFMYGRNGADSLYKASVAVYFAMAAANLFLRSAILSILMWALFIWATFRCFSKNVYKRSLENQAFLRIEEKAARKFKMTKTMLTDKEHCYKKCSHCKAYLRLPKRSGTHTAVCPKCGEKLTVRIR